MRAAATGEKSRSTFFINYAPLPRLTFLYSPPVPGFRRRESELKFDKCQCQWTDVVIHPIISSTDAGPMRAWRPDSHCILKREATRRKVTYGPRQ